MFLNRFDYPALTAGIFSLLFSCLLNGESHAAGVPSEIESQIRRLGGKTGLMVKELGSGGWRAESMGALPLNPASTMKVPSTYAALQILGPEYRFKTSVHLRGKLHDGVLSGDLIWKGGGDPKFVIEDLTEFIVQLRALGLNEIRGDLLLDDSQFELTGEGSDSIDGDVSQPYNVPPYAALMNFKATKFVFTPNSESVTVTLDPPLADVYLKNSVQLVKGACRFGAAGIAYGPQDSLLIGGKPVISVAGRYSAGCGEQGFYSAVLDHRQFAHAFFKAAWLAAGGQFGGQTKIVTGAAKGLPVFATWTAPRTVTDLVRDANKFSNNVVTRQLLLQSAYETYKLPANVERARNFLTSFLQNKNVQLDGFVVDNGSGLSRKERVSALSMVQVLESAFNSSVATQLIESLPSVGVDGTMKNRMRNHAIVGNAWIKTGTLKDVRSIAGYVRSQNGKWYALSMMTNGATGDDVTAAQDKVLSWLYYLP